MNAPANTNRKAELLANTVEHVAIDQYDARPVIDAMRKMSFTSRDTARAADIWSMSLEDADCSTWLTLAGSTSAGGCMHIYRDMLKYGMIDVVVATGASIVDMDFFEALGFKHYQAQSNVDDRDLASSTSIGSTTPTSTRKSSRTATARSIRSANCWSRVPIRAASSSTRWASGWPPATPRSPTA